MRGGYDAANLLVPISSSYYYEVRPNIAVPKLGSATDTAIALDADWGLHPSLRNSILLTDFDRRLRTLLVTSAAPSEGKSTIAIHTAVALLHGGARVRRFDVGAVGAHPGRVF